MIDLSSISAAMVMCITVGYVSCRRLPCPVPSIEFRCIIRQRRTKTVQDCRYPQKCGWKSLRNGGSGSIMAGDWVFSETVDPSTVEGDRGIWIGINHRYNYEIFYRSL